MNLQEQSLTAKVSQFIDKNLLASITVSFILGMCISYGRELTSLYYIIALSVLCFLSVCLIHKPHKLFLLCFLFLLIGYLHQGLHTKQPFSPSHVYNLFKTPKEVSLIGIISEMATFNGRTSRIVIESKFIRYPDKERLQPTEGKVQFSFAEKIDDNLKPGTTVAIRSKLKRVAGYDGEGVFNYPRFLAQKDIWITGFIHSPLFIARVDSTGSLYDKVRYFPERLRHDIGKYLDKSSSNSGLYRAILIGDKSQIPNDTLEAFKASGVMHILAISGLHVAVITSFIYGCVLFLLRRSSRLMLLFNIRKLAAIISMPPLVFYCLLTGSNTPVVRSLLMALLILLALCINRKISALAVLSCAALIIVIMSPHQLFTASFQLSFVAISSILFLLPTLQNFFQPQSDKSSLTFFQKTKAWVYSSILVSVVASLATMPLLLFYFNRFSFISPFTNLIVEPIVCLWSLPLGIIALPFIKLTPSIADFLIYCGSLGLNITNTFCIKIVEFPYIQKWLNTPSIPLIALYLFSLTAIIKCKVRFLRISSVFVFFTTLILLFVSPQSYFNKHEETKITFIDVGQGSATLIEFPNGQNVLADCGGTSFSTRTVGEMVVAPMLWKKRIKKIDTIFISHGDSDHYNGLPTIVNHFDVDQVVIPSKNGNSSNFINMLKDIKSKGVIIKSAQANDIFEFGKNKIRCIHNFAHNKEANSRLNPNRGIVLQAQVGDFSLLLPGDIGFNAEMYLTNKEIESNILLAAHHGSKTSNSKQFLQATSPDFLLVSAGVSRGKYFPHPTVVERAKELDIPILSTAQNGSLEVIIDNQGYKILGKKTRDNNPLLAPDATCLSCSTAVFQQ